MPPKKLSFENYRYQDTEEYKVHLRAMQMFDAMTPEQRRQTFIDAGVITPDGALIEPKDDEQNDPLSER